MNARTLERGFTLIELLIVLSIVSILLRVSLPAFDAVRRDAVASKAVGDFNVVRAAAIAQFEATGSYPADAVPGVVPGGMKPFLPTDFAFEKPEYELDWDNYTVADSASGSSGQVIALTYVPKDPKTGLQILNMLGDNCTHWSVDDAHTFVILSTIEAPR